MAFRRKYGEDLTYAEEHRKRLPEFYGRIGHRIHMADRDWTEACCVCREPLMIIEEVRDRGQDLNDKGTTITRRLSERSEVPSILLAWAAERPENVDAEIEALWSRLMDLYSYYPITRFRVRKLYPDGSREILEFTPEEWWREVLLWHRDHHDVCERAQNRVDIPAVRRIRLAEAKERSRLWNPRQLRLVK